MVSMMKHTVFIVPAQICNKYDKHTQIYASDKSPWMKETKKKKNLNLFYWIFSIFLHDQASQIEVDNFRKRKKQKYGLKF